MILQAKNIALQLGSASILNQINLTLNDGELLGLIGPNGAGKTSLLRILAHLQKPSRGELQLNNKPVSHLDRKQLAQTIGYLAQGAPAHWPLHVRRLVELGRLPYLAPWSKLCDNDHRIVEQAMTMAEVSHLANRIVSTLSGGERMRVLIARLFATQPTIILADEPTAALDPYHQLHTMELLREHCDRGGSGVVVMHDLNIAARFCHRLLLLHHGEMVSEGSALHVLQPERLQQVYGISAQVLNNDSGLSVIAHSRAVNEQR